MFTPRDYPYVCSYLGWLIVKEKIDSTDLLLQRTEEMYQWLKSNLTKDDGKEDWMWSDKKDRKVGSTWIDDNPGSVFRLRHPITHMEVRVSRFIFFKHESDLLAFKLRFGIIGELSSNMLISL